MKEIVPFDEIQKEAAKAFGQEVAIQIIGFLGDITRPPAKELGGLLADKLQYFRFKQQIKTLKKARDFLEEQGINPQQVSLKFLAPFFEHCSWEETEYMQDKWASLLANSMSVGANQENFISYVELLRQVSPIQAKFLDLIYEDINFVEMLEYGRRLPSYKSPLSYQPVLNLSSDDLQILLDSLIRLNLIQFELPLKQLVALEKKRRFQREDELEIKIAPNAQYYMRNKISLTYLGHDFVKQCKISFSDNHIEQIKKTYESSFEDIIRDISGGAKIDKFVADVVNIYKYGKDEHIRSAIRKSIRECIPGAGQLDNIRSVSIGPNQALEVLNRTLEILRKLYP
ncbi:MAG: Abi-alpha family protein [Thermodesulfobacteriota bacterium]